MEKEYKVIHGISFDVRTPLQVCNILESALHTNRRLRLFYGDSETGKCWMEEHDIMGTIGQSCGGNRHVPLLINNNRSMGGPAILDYCIVKITENKNTLYRHPLFHIPALTRNGRHVFNEKGLVATMDTPEKAERYIQFMEGKRNSK
jgi:hypothetical protein